MALTRRAFALASAAASLTAPKSVAATSARAELVIGLTRELPSLNPLYLFAGDYYMLGAFIYSQLLRVSPSGQLIPSVAQRVPTQENGDISKDGLSITYRLRKDVKWADGEPLTARDVVFTHRAVTNPKNSVVDSSIDERVASIDQDGPYIARVRLKAAYSPFTLLFNRPLLPAHLLAKFDSLDKVDYNANPVGSGPYQVSEWHRGDHVTFTRSDKYWGPSARIPKIVIRFISNPSTLLTEIRSRDLNAALYLEPNDVKYVSSEPELKAQRMPTPGFGLLIFNGSNPTLRDVRVRRAILFALDRSRITRDATAGLDESSRSGEGLFGWAYDPSIGAPTYNRAKAQRLLDDSGWAAGPDGIRVRNGQRLALNLAIQSGHPSFAIEANEIAQQLKDVGITVNIESYVDQEYWSASGGVLFGGRFDIALTAFFGTGQPFDAEYYIGCNASGKPNVYNFSHMCIPGVQPLLRDAVTTFDRKRQERDYRDVQRLLGEQVPLIPISRTFLFNVIPKNLRNFAPSLTGGVFNGVESWWLS